MAGMDCTTILKRAREKAGCTRQCSLSGAERECIPAVRFTHNGVSFSRQVDVDYYLLKVDEDGMIDLLATFCREHHAGRDGRDFILERAGGEKIYVHVPEAVG